MRKPVSTDQSHQLMCTLSTNVDWSVLDAGVIQRIIKDPIRAGKEFTAFLRNGARLMVSEPKVIQIDPTQLFNPAEFIGEGWTTDEQDECSLAITALDLSKIQIEISLKAGETSITGEEKLTRLKAMNVIRHGGNEFLALWNDYQAHGENSGLEWLRRNRGITYLDFLGLILRNPAGRRSRSVLFLHWNGLRWNWNHNWLGSAWPSDRLSAVSDK